VSLPKRKSLKPQVSSCCVPWWWFAPYLGLIVVFLVVVLVLMGLGCPVLVAVGVPSTLSAVAVRGMRQVVLLARQAPRSA
jgi:hypothetical protein